MLTPADIKNRTIKTTMGGYNKKDTDEFIASVLESFEELNNENKKLEEKLASLSDGIQYYKNLEDNLQKALVLAEKTSDETKSAAKAEAANIVSLAKAEASDIVSKAKLEADELIKNTKSDIDKNVVEAQHKANILNERLSRLTSSFESYKRDIKAIVEDQLEFIESEDYSPKTPVFDIPNMIGAVTDENEDINENKSDESLDNELENSVLFKWTSVSNDGEQASVSDDTNEVSEDDNSIKKNQTTEIADENNIDDDNSDNNDTDNGNLDNIIDNVIEKADVMNEISAVDESDIEKVNNKTEIKETEINEKEIKEDDSDDIIVKNIMTTPTLEGVNAEISSTVFPASKPDNMSVSYLSENTDSVKKDSNDDANDNPFTFIDLD